VHQGVAQLGTVQEGGRLVLSGGCTVWLMGTGVASGPNLCTAHPSILAPNPLRCRVERPPFQVTPYDLANVSPKR
jgi:hypothetical protein